MTDTRHYNLQLDSLKRELYYLIEQKANDAKFAINSSISNFKVTTVGWGIEIEKYLQSRRYVKRVIGGRTVFQNNFVVVEVSENGVLVWNDIPSAKKFEIKESIFTGLPLALDYFERL